jgi:hypothetical protein
LRNFTGQVSTGDSPGKLIARTLNGAWRRVPGPLSISPDEVHQIASLLLVTGTAALAWRQMQPCEVISSWALAYFKEAYRKHTIEAAVHEVNIRDAFRRLRAANIEPILFKGWALARLYPEEGLRPYGDLDLWMRAQDLDRFNDVLMTSGEPGYCVEPHVSFYPQYARSFAEIMDRSQLVPLTDTQVRVPGDEDHLRFICLHFLYHGGWRPLWLCDIALMAEAARTGFDWDLCLRGDRKHADWIACAIGVAHELLGADVSGTPVEKRVRTLPGWLIPAVLKQWEKGGGMSFAENLSFSLPRRLLNPRALVRALRDHWRNPVQASVEMNAWFNDTPRLPLQFGSAVKHIPRFAKYFGKEIRRP